MDDTPLLLRTSTRLVTDLLGERGSCILLAGGAHVAASTHSPSLTHLRIDLARYPEVAAAIQGNTVVAIEDVWADPRLSAVRALLPERLRSIAVVPLSAGDGVIGVWTVVSSSATTFPEEALKSAVLLGKLTASLLAARSTSTPAASIPTERPAIANATPPGARPPVSSGNGQRVLVVDDDPATRSALAMLLEYEGYRVEEARDGAEGVRQARSIHPALVLLDVAMPVLDGLRAAEQLRADPRTADIPVLFLSGSDNLTTRVRGFKLDATDFVVKPVDADDLMARIARSLRHAEARHQLREDANRDSLTGLGNLRVLKERLAHERARGHRPGTSVAAVMIDVDRLKEINDRFGHAAGSEALAQIGRVLNSQTRGADVAVRYGGDEFVVLLPEISPADATAFAERVLASVRAIEGPANPTVSIGVAALAQGSVAEDDLLKRADLAVYRAKRSGGNCVCVYDGVVDIP